MPAEISEGWEYWTPSEEWSEAFEGDTTDGERLQTQYQEHWKTGFEGYRVSRRPDDDAYRFLKTAPARWSRPDRLPLRRCRRCPRLFTPRHRHQRYCGTDCSAESRITCRPKPCRHCGEVFTPSRGGRQYCGGVCSAAARVTLSPRECGTCGATFRPVDNSRKYCGVACGWAAMVKLRPIPCGGCGREFLPRQTGRQHCSRRCAGRMISGLKSGVPVSLDWDRIVELYADGTCISDIAKALRAARGEVRRALVARGVYKRGKPGVPRRLPDAECGHCRNVFRPDNGYRVYCSPKCTAAGRNRTPIDHKRAVEMYRQGVSVLEIARRMNCSDAGVRYAIKRATTTNTESGT